MPAKRLRWKQFDGGWNFLFNGEWIGPYDTKEEARADELGLRRFQELVEKEERRRRPRKPKREEKPAARVEEEKVEGMLF